MIDFVDYSTLESVEQSISAKRARSRDDQYEVWKRYHDALCKIAARFGKVDWTPSDGVDVYFSGDWSHEHDDGFALYTTKCLNPDALHQFQKVVAQHHPDAALSLGGDEGSLIGLRILITPSVILVAWTDESADSCKRKLEDLGVNLA